MITVTINGKRESLAGPTHLTDYLDGRVEAGLMVAIGHNGHVLHRREWADMVLQDGDVVDIVHMVGGGC